MPDWLMDASAWVIPVVLAITLHEAAHGLVARWFGDDTATRAGRVSLNPLKHIDRFGTVLLPAVLLLLKSPVMFGYAKPVPVDFTQLQPRKIGVLAVALAGVSMNLLLAFIAALLLHVAELLPPQDAEWLLLNLYRAVFINCVLIVFNLIPILPLDGGRALHILLPERLARPFARLERLGVVLVFAALALPVFLGFDVARVIILEPAQWLVSHVLAFTGNGTLD